MFINKGLSNQISNYHTKIRCHMIFTVKHHGWHTARFVTGGHLTQPAIESVYSGVVSICSIHLILLITDLNDLTIYQQICLLRSIQKRQDFFITRREFTTFGMEGRILFADMLHIEGFTLCKADSDIWM